MNIQPLCFPIVILNTDWSRKRGAGCVLMNWRLRRAFFGAPVSQNVVVKHGVCPRNRSLCPFHFHNRSLHWTMVLIKNQRFHKRMRVHIWGRYRCRGTRAGSQASVYRSCVCEGAPAMRLCECVFLFVCVGSAAEGPTEAPNGKVRPFHFRSNGCHLKPEACWVVLAGRIRGEVFLSPQQTWV